MARTKAQRRKLKKRLDAPFVPGSPLSYRDVAHERNAEQALRYGPVENQLRDRQTNTTNWFDQYKRDVASKGVQQGQVYGQAVTDIGAQAVASREAAERQRAVLDAEARADAASRGATYSGMPGAQSSGAADVRQGLAELFGNLMRTQGTSYGNYTADQGTVGSAAQLSERLKTQQAGVDVAKEKAEFGTSYLARRRNEEIANVLERAAFNLDVFEARNKNKPKPLTPSEQAAKDRNEFFRKHGYYPPTGPPKSKDSKTKIPKPDVKIKAKIRSGVRLVQKRDNGLPTFWKDIYGTLVDVDKVDPVVASAIIQGARYGRLGKKTARTLLEDYGISAKDLGFTSRKKRPKPTPVTPPPQTPGPSGETRPT